MINDSFESEMRCHEKMNGKKVLNVTEDHAREQC